MFQLDNRKPEYTWKSEWNIPYESIWGRIEKFRSVNALLPVQLDKIIKIGGYKYEHFNLFRYVHCFLWCNDCYTFVSLGAEMDE